MPAGPKGGGPGGSGGSLTLVALNVGGGLLVFGPISLVGLGGWLLVVVPIVGGLGGRSEADAAKEARGVCGGLLKVVQ